jgi:hypothetical protein
MVGVVTGIYRPPGIAEITLSQVQALLQRTATDLKYPATRQGWGLIDVVKMLAAP